MHGEFGIVRVAAAVPRVSVGDPLANTTEILAVLTQCEDADVVVFPELCISGYSCGRLFHQQALLNDTVQQLTRLAQQMPNPQQLILVGAPLRSGNALYNCAVAINDNRIVGVAPKQFVPNYNEFYETRWFASADDAAQLESHIVIGDYEVPFGIDLLYTHRQGDHEAVIHVEICEAMWMPIPPSSYASIAGAQILCNLSASPETVGKAHYRRTLVSAQAGRCQAAYVYTSSAATESTAELVFGGHALISEGGSIKAESARVGDSGETRRDSYWIAADIDVERLQTERRNTTTFAQSSRFARHPWRRLPVKLDHADLELLHAVPALPFVPARAEELASRCAEVFGIQTAALAKRIECLGSNPRLVIGISGGLDSTLALLVAVRTCDLLGLPRSTIRAVTMPGFGTTDGTLKNAHDLMRHLGVEAIEIDIRPACLLEYGDLAAATGYQPFGEISLQPMPSLDEFVASLQQVPAAKRQDLTFENVQARRRTELLMNMGFVLGTGDMSELWLGWCTYNADQQSMYNVNCSVPKTLVRFLVGYVAETDFEGDVTETLKSICNTEISPELLPPGAAGEILQSTEDTIGPYELHDFFMFQIARFGFSPAKVLYLARQAEGWSRDYSHDELRHWLSMNIKRAFSQQYKRDNIPNGPKVGSLSLSPRGDWRMPSDAVASAWLRSLESASADG